MEYVPQQYLENLENLYEILFDCWGAGYKFPKIVETVRRNYSEDIFSEADIKERFKFMWRTELSDKPKLLKH